MAARGGQQKLCEEASGLQCCVIVVLLKKFLGSIGLRNKSQLSFFFKASGVEEGPFVVGSRGSSYSRRNS
jgi:hypothetical protein